VKPAAVLIDIPIGLSSTGSAERTVDGLARALLKPRRQASIFTPPCREALSAGTYAEACRINQRICGRKISIQTWHITAKIKEVDDFLQATPGARGILRETHPEMCFWSLAGGKPLRYAKKSAEGRRERLDLLQSIYPASSELYRVALERFPRGAVARDDILDALANAVTATRLKSSGQTLPENPPRDMCGLPMEMVYLSPVNLRP
jgi:predicted RNase H-like nuclease